MARGNVTTERLLQVQGMAHDLMDVCREIERDHDGDRFDETADAFATARTMVATAKAASSLAAALLMRHDMQKTRAKLDAAAAK